MARTARLDLAAKAVAVGVTVTVVGALTELLLGPRAFDPLSIGLIGAGCYLLGTTDG